MSVSSASRRNTDGSSREALPDLLRLHPEVAQAIRPGYTVAKTSYGSMSQAMGACSALDLDFDAINCFLRAGFYLRGRTPFKQIRREWKAPPVVPTRPRGRAEAVQEFADTFRAAVTRLDHENAAVGLSGGADSRHILLELVKLDRLPELALTVDLPSSEDADIARRLASRCNVRHQVVAPTDGLDDEIRKCALVDFMSLQHRWFMAVVDQLSSRRWWDGIGGDVLSAGLFLEPWNLHLMETGQFEAFANRLVPAGNVYWFGPAGRFDRDQAVHDIVEELRLHANAANPVGSFYFWNRTCTDIAMSPFGILAHHGVQVLAPYLEHDVFEFLMSLPASLLLDHQFHVETIRAAHPAAADLPYARKLPLPAGVQRRLGRAVLPLLWQRFSSEPRLASLKVLASSARASVTGRGSPGSMMEALVYSNALTAAVETHRRGS